MRYLIATVALLVLLGGLAGVKAAQIHALMTHGKEARLAGPPPESVAATAVRAETWDRTLVGVGTVASGKGVTLASELPGVVTHIHFESGAAVRRGTLLVELDTTVERSQLDAALARKHLAETTFARTVSLERSGAAPPAALDADRAALETASKEVDGLRAQIEKKSVRAPFAGKLGIRLIDVGQYVAPGTPMTSLETTDSRFVDFDLDQGALRELTVGLPVRVTFAAGADGGVAPGSRGGVIEAIEPAVDRSTRTVKVRARINDTEGLRAGMFVDVAVVLAGSRRVIAVPATAVVHASFGDSLFVVERSAGQAVARQQFVRTGEMRGDFVEVVAGVEPGTEVVTAGAFKLQSGSPVVVREGVAPTPETHPRPQNR